MSKRSPWKAACLRLPLTYVCLHWPSCFPCLGVCRAAPPSARSAAPLQTPRSLGSLLRCHLLGEVFMSSPLTFSFCCLHGTWLPSHKSAFPSWTSWSLLKSVTNLLESRHVSVLNSFVFHYPAHGNHSINIYFNKIRDRSGFSIFYDLGQII